MRITCADPRARLLVAAAIVATLFGVGLGGWLLRRRAARDAGALVVRRAEAMATRIEVVLPRGQAQLAEVVFDVFRRVDRQMSEWKDGSPLAAVNRAAGQRAVAVPAELLSLVQRGLRISRETDGAFDISWAALWGLWRFTGPQRAVPPATAIARRLPLVDYRAVRVDAKAGTIALSRRGMKIGLGALAKGYALDRAADRLRALGARDFVISAGGQVYAAGRHPGDPRSGAPPRPWRVGVRDPRGAPGVSLLALALSNTSVSTSGDYERYFIEHGVRYHHILDPRTGRPARGLRSVSVICADATRADALSTAIMVLGKQRGLALARRTPGVEVLLVDDRGALSMTDGARRLLARPAAAAGRSMTR